MGGGRTESSGDYRYGFNGKEKDDKGEWGGEYLTSATCCDSEGNVIINYTLQKSQTYYDYGFRIYNPGIGKFLSVDPLTQQYPWYTPYQFAGNKPITAIDVDGREEDYVFNSPVKTTAVMDILNDEKLTQQQKEDAIFVLAEYWLDDEWPNEEDYDWLNRTAKTVLYENEQTWEISLSDGSFENKVVKKQPNGSSNVVGFYGHFWNDMKEGIIEKQLLFSVTFPKNVDVEDGSREATAWENFLFWRIKDLQDVDDLVTFVGILARKEANTGGTDALQPDMQDDIIFGDSPSSGFLGWLNKKLEEWNPQDYSGNVEFDWEGHKDFKQYKDTQYIIDWYSGDTLKRIIEKVRVIQGTDREEREKVSESENN